MSEREDIASAVSRMQSKFGARRELKALPGELWEGETVSHIASGAYSNGVGILVATDRRLLFLFQGLTRQISEDFSYDRISSIELKGGMLLSSINVYVSNKKAEIKNLSKEEAKRIVDDVRGRMNQRSAPAPAPAADTATAPNVADELLKLKQLHDAGVLDDATYTAKSAPLIAQL